MRVVGILVLLSVVCWSTCDHIDNLLQTAEDDSTKTSELLSSVHLDMNDLNREDDFDPKDDVSSVDEMISTWDDGEDGVASRSSVGKKLISFGTKALRKVRTKLGKSIRKMRKAFVKKYNKLKQKSIKGWQMFKKKFTKKAGKKLVKSVLKEVYETGKEEALEYLKAAVLEWVDKKIVGTMCECFMEEKKGDEKLTDAQKKRLIKKRGVRKCRCCIRPPGFKRSCLKVIANLKSKTFDISITFNKVEFLKTNLIVPKEEQARSVCSAPKVACPQRDVCAQMPEMFHFLAVCISPGNVVLDKAQNGDIDGFGACFQVKIGKLGLNFEKCVQYDFDEKELSFVEELEEDEEDEED